jgi:hypothetical protein
VFGRVAARARPVPTGILNPVTAELNAKSLRADLDRHHASRIIARLNSASSSKDLSDRTTLMILVDALVLIGLAAMTLESTGFAVACCGLAVLVLRLISVV